MLRYLAAMASGLFLAGAGFFIGQGRAETDPVPPAPEAAALMTPLRPEARRAPPEASEKSKEEKRFARADQNDDGRVARAELLEPRLKAFAKLDSNGDGRLAFEEWAVKTTEKFASADADRDGNLTPAEYGTTKPKPAKRKCAC